MKSKMPKILASLKVIVLLIYVLEIITGDSLWAFKMKAHTYIADKTREEILKKSEISFPGLPEYLQNIPVHNEEVLEAIRKYPAHYRAGAIGPDGFPDMIEGQIQTHANLGEKEGVASDVPFEARKFKELRSIDHFMIMLREVYIFDMGREERLQALAYIYGFATHMTTDAFAHEFMNEWTWGVFDFTTGTGLYSSFTEEIKHIAAESYIENFIPSRGEAELELKIPSRFLYHLFTMPIKGMKEMGKAGSEGGIFYRKLVEARKVLLAFSGKKNKELDLDQTSYDIIQNLNREIGDQTKSFDESQNKAFVIADLQKELDLEESDTDTDSDSDSLNRSLFGGKKTKAKPSSGSGSSEDLKLKSVGKLLIEALKGMHLKQFFEVRAKLIDIFMQKWPELNLCVNQNMLWASNLRADEPLDHDACSRINFESEPEIQKIFHGKLNKAIKSVGKSKNDFGGLSTNLKKLIEFVSLFVDRIFKFHPLQDIKGLEALNEIVAKCKSAKYSKSLDKTIELDVTDLDPELDNIPDIEASIQSMEVNEKGLRSMIHGATMFVTWGACKAIVVAHDKLSDLKKMINRQIDKVINKIKAAILKRFYETDFGKIILALKDLHNLKNKNGPAMFIKVAFLEEDLKGNFPYLNQILKKSLTLNHDVVDSALPTDQSIEHTYQLTVAKGSELLKKSFPELRRSGSSDVVWSGFIKMLFKLVTNRTPDRKKAILQTADISWSKNIKLEEDLSETQKQSKEWMQNNSESTTRGFLSFSDQMAKIMQIINQLKILLEVRGTALHSVREQMNLPPEDSSLPPEYPFYDSIVGTKKFINVELNRFYPIYNALNMAKLTLLGKPGVEELLRRKGYSLSPNSFGRSRICREVPFIACDMIVSLDDPNGFGKQPPIESIYSEQSDSRSNYVDANRSLSLWVAKTTEWTTDQVLPSAPAKFDARRDAGCVFSLTNFVFSNNWNVVKDYYLQIFDVPPGCEWLRDDINNKIRP